MVDLSYPYRWSIIFHTTGKQAQPGSQTHKISCSTLRLEIQRIHASAYDADADYQGRTQERLLTGIRKNHPLHGLAITMNPLVNISKCFLQADANVVSLLLPVVSRGRSHVRMCPLLQLVMMDSSVNSSQHSGSTSTTLDMTGGSIAVVALGSTGCSTVWSSSLS